MSQYHLEKCFCPEAVAVVGASERRGSVGRAVIETGEAIFVRPIQPEDAPMFEALFDAMSTESIHYRFFSTMRHLPKPMLARFTQIDYDRQIALVALGTEEGRERMLGCCRIIADPDGREGEFAIMVADRWQGCGVGATLLKKCLAIAKSRGMQDVKGVVLPGNRQMLRLGRGLGFEIANIAGASEKELHIDLSTYQPC
ncbi:MAG: GNAT family N-acetyltransferase [Thermodesulfobacteriota bacterium]